MRQYYRWVSPGRGPALNILKDIKPTIAVQRSPRLPPNHIRCYLAVIATTTTASP